MSLIPYDSCIQCVFEPGTKKVPDYPSGKIDVYYGMTEDVSSKFTDLEKYVTRAEKIRSDEFHFKEDRDTFITCHSLLRLVLSEKLGINPFEIDIHNDRYNKPVLDGNPVYFNISHARSAFAFVISRYFYAGIDLEHRFRCIDILPVINTYLSQKERSFVLGSNDNTLENFFLIWTRKESLLKAIGTGLTINPAQVEVSEMRNLIFTGTFLDKISGEINSEHFIYSKKVSEYYLSIAVPQKAEINLHQINWENICSYTI